MLDCLSRHFSVPGDSSRARFRAREHHQRPEAARMLDRNIPWFTRSTRARCRLKMLQSHFC